MGLLHQVDRTTTYQAGYTSSPGESTLFERLTALRPVAIHLAKSKMG
jgi:hypothetical protein